MTKTHRTRLLRIILFAGTITSLFFVPWVLLFAWLKPLPDTVQEQVEDALKYDFDGIVVYVDQAGQAPGYYAAGWHDRDAKIPAKPDALFKIASVDKLYTALSIAKLVKSGHINLDYSLAHYFPELEGRIEYANDITIRMMVQHRSGIPNFTDTFNYWANPKEGYQERLDLILDQPADFKPNTAYAYCNTNYLLLAKLIEKASGKDTATYIQEVILDPLQLTNTYTSLDGAPLDRVMSGYYVGYDQDLKTESRWAMLATAEDLGKFIRALNDGSAFTDKAEQDIYSSIYKYEHTGLIPGYQTIAKYHPDIDTVIIQFTNTVDFEGYNWSLSEIVYNKIVKLVEESPN